jgi:hypothetical protein
MKKIIKEDFSQDRKSALEAEYYENEHKRKENFRKQFSWILISVLWISSFIVLSMTFIWFYHFLSPEHWHFLSADRVQEIQHMLFAGLVSQAIPYISSYLKKQS